jgi:Na+/H+ antiporter
MHLVHHFELVLLLLAVALGLELLARRLHLPPAAMLIVGGIMLAMVPGAPGIELDPDLVMVLFLPPLLMSDAYLTAWRDFRANLRIILQLAVGAVAFTTLVVGLVTHWVMLGLPWAGCFALGAIVSPPDAVAAKAVLEHVKLPRRVMVLLEGESVVNDASGLVLYRFAVAAALTGSFSLGHAALSCAVLGVGGVVFGLAAGFVASFIFARLSEPNFATVVSFLMGWAAYVGAEALELSGVLATVTLGMVVGWHQHEVLSAETRVASKATWQFIIFVLESLSFILIGLSLRGVIARFDGGWTAALSFAGPIAAVVLAVILSRFAWVLPSTYLTRWLLPGLRQRPVSAAGCARHHQLGRYAGRGYAGRRVGLAGRISRPRFRAGDQLCRDPGDRAGAGRDAGSADPPPARGPFRRDRARAADRVTGPRPDGSGSVAGDRTRLADGGRHRDSSAAAGTIRLPRQGRRTVQQREQSPLPTTLRALRVELLPTQL